VPDADVIDVSLTTALDLVLDDADCRGVCAYPQISERSARMRGRMMSARGWTSRSLYRDARALSCGKNPSPRATQAPVVWPVTLPNTSANIAWITFVICSTTYKCKAVEGTLAQVGQHKRAQRAQAQDPEKYHF
jgi:hypothetical protein